MAEPPRVRVSFRKQVSDGNYGTEAAEVTVECDADIGLIDGLMEKSGPIADLLADARALAHFELNSSPSPSVRRALEPPPAPRSNFSTPAPAPDEAPF